MLIRSNLTSDSVGIKFLVTWEVPVWCSNCIFIITNIHWLSSSSLKHDTCPVCRKSLNGDESGTQSSSEPSSLNTDPRTPERWSFWNTHTHVRPSHPSSVLTQACLSVFPFCQYFVFILPWWYIFTMVYLLIFSNTVLLSCVYANVSISFPYFRRLWFLPQFSA